MKRHSFIAALALLVATTGAVNAQTRNWGCTPEVQQDMLATVSLYQSDIKEYKNSKDERYLFEAYPKWKMIVANCPKQSKNLYLNGVNIHQPVENRRGTQRIH